VAKSAESVLTSEQRAEIARMIAAAVPNLIREALATATRPSLPRRS
jgi:hypothetical protein